MNQIAYNEDRRITPETRAMAHHGWIEFWRKRGHVPPPRISHYTLGSFALPGESWNDDFMFGKGFK
jgi:hypothetical protein